MTTSIRPGTLRSISWALALLLTAAAGAAEPTLARLILQLADSDPGAREQAAVQLVARGREAREALAEAQESDDPQLRAAAGQVLLQIPFDDPGDPPPVRQILAAWGKSPDPQRAAQLRGLVSAAGPGAPAILLRLVGLEPSDRVRWAIVASFRAAPAWRSAIPLAGFEAAGRRNRAPNVALLGWALEPSDPARALAAYRRCMQLEAQQPSDDGGDAEPVFEALYRSELIARRYDEAARVIRVQAFRKPGTEESLYGRTNRTDELFYLHSRFGPLKGFESDVAAHRALLSRAPVAYCLGVLYEKRVEQPLVADALYRAAFLSTAGSAEGRDTASEFLTSHRLNDLALQELLAIVAASKGAAQDTAASVNYVNAHLRMGIVYAAMGDDRSAGDSLREAMETISRVPGRILTRTRGDRKYSGQEAENLIWAEVHWHYFRAAQARRDEPEMLRQIDSMIALAPADEHLVLDMLPELVDRGQSERAARLFESPFKALKARLDEKPDDAELLNNLAWLCARAAQRLDEARVWADKAVRGRPDRYAYLDTAAEVEFRLGNIDRAIELETRALKLSPDESFLKEQIERFKTARRGK